MRVGSVHSLRKIAVGMGALAIAFGAVPAVAGDVQTTNNGGGSTNPNPGSVVDVSWNPENRCDVASGETLAELLACMASWIDPFYFCNPGNPASGGAQLPPGFSKQQIYPGDQCDQPLDRSQYKVYTTPTGSSLPTGLHIELRDPDAGGSTEPYKLYIYENDPNIQWVTLTLNRGGMRGRFGVVTETAQGGSITLVVNGAFLPPVTTFPGQSGVTVTRMLSGALTQAGYVVNNDGAFLNVTATGLHSITNIAWISFDSGIVSSTLSLDQNPPLIDGGE